MIIKSAADIGHLVRDFRTRRGLTQARLAADVGVSRKWIIDLEAGKRTAELSLVLRTLNVLGVELDAKARTRNRIGNSDIDLNSLIAQSRGFKS